MMFSRITQNGWSQPHVPPARPIPRRQISDEEMARYRQAELDAQDEEDEEDYEDD